MEFIVIYVLMVASFIVGIVILPALQKKPNIANFLAHGLAVIGSFAAVVCAIFVFATSAQGFSLPTTVPFLTVSVRVDNLAAFFLAIIGIVGGSASMYAIAYSKEYFGKRFNTMAGLYLAFLLSMLLVVTVSNIVAFLIVWELMTIFSFLLVGHEHEKITSTRASYLYLVMTHVGTAFIVIAFLLLWGAGGSADFAALSAAGADGYIRNLIFICSFIGFGTKAGVVPLHIWLPEAHPAAPTHVSAVMSGVMIKTAIYGMARFYLEFLGAGPAWWGMVILLFAIISAVLGVLYALMEHDIKSLLAYHSVENIGIILLGMGAGLVFMSKGMNGLAGFAWAAALFHVLNHALFKSLLFFGAGAVIGATHTRDIEHLGGLIKYMPFTAVFFLAGAAAISALPPLNGFVSEWLTFQSIFVLPEALQGTMGKPVAAILVSLLGLTGALAAACFVKAFGMIFLAKPRSSQVDHAKEASWFMLVPMGFLTALCVIFGVFPAWLVNFLQRTLADFFGAGAYSVLETDWYMVAFQSVASSGELSFPAVLVFIAVGLVMGGVIYRLYGKPRYESGETWTCGIVPTGKMEYTATGFSGPIRRAFGRILRPQTELIADNKESPFFSRQVVFHVHVTNVFTEMLYKPLNRVIVTASHFMKEMQTGSVQLYVGYIMVVTIIVLVWSTRW